MRLAKHPMDFKENGWFFGNQHWVFTRGFNNNSAVSINSSADHHCHVQKFRRTVAMTTQCMQKYEQQRCFCRRSFHARVTTGHDLGQGFSNYGSPRQIGTRNVILGSRNKLAWEIIYKCFCKLMWRLHVSLKLDCPSRGRLEKPFLK